MVFCGGVGLYLLLDGNTEEGRDGRSDTNLGFSVTTGTAVGSGLLTLVFVWLVQLRGWCGVGLRFWGLHCGSEWV